MWTTQRKKGMYSPSIPSAISKGSSWRRKRIVWPRIKGKSLRSMKLKLKVFQADTNLLFRVVIMWVQEQLITSCRQVPRYRQNRMSLNFMSLLVSSCNFFLHQLGIANNSRRLNISLFCFFESTVLTAKTAPGAFSQRLVSPVPAACVQWSRAVSLQCGKRDKE